MSRTKPPSEDRAGRAAARRRASAGVVPAPAPIFPAPQGCYEGSRCLLFHLSGRSTGVERQRLLVFELQVFNDDRVDADAHDLVALAEHVAFGGDENRSVGVEQEGPLARVVGLIGEAVEFPLDGGALGFDGVSDSRFTDTANGSALCSSSCALATCSGLGASGSLRAVNWKRLRSTPPNSTARTLASRSVRSVGSTFMGSSGSSDEPENDGRKRCPAVFTGRARAAGRWTTRGAAVLVTATGGAEDTTDGPLKYCRKIVTAAMTDRTISRMTLLRSAPSFIGPLIGESADRLIR